MSIYASAGAYMYIHIYPSTHMHSYARTHLQTHLYANTQICMLETYIHMHKHVTFGSIIGDANARDWNGA